MKPFNLRTELWVMTNTTLLSLLLLPAAVYIVGRKLFSPYSSGIAGFYHEYLTGLIQGQLPALILALGPTCALLLVRFILRIKPAKIRKSKS